MEFIHDGEKEIHFFCHGQVCADREALDPQRADLFDGLIRLVCRATIMQRDGISHARKGEGKGFAKTMCAAGDEGERGRSCQSGVPVLFQGWKVIIISKDIIPQGYLPIKSICKNTFYKIMMNIILQYAPTEEDYKDLARAHAFKLWQIFSALNIPLLLFSIRIICEVEDLASIKADWASYFFLVLFFLFIITLFIAFVINPIRVVHEARKKEASFSPIEYEISNSQVVLKRESTNITVDWESLHQCLETKRSFFLINLNRNMSQVLIPKRALTYNDEILLREIVAKKKLMTRNISLDIFNNPYFAAKILMVFTAYIFSFIVLCGYSIYTSLQ